MNLIFNHMATYLQIPLA